MMTTHVVRCAHAVPRALGMAALLFGALAARPAAAQTASRPGLWIDAGVGVGYLRLTCANCSGVAANGAALTVSAGGGVTQNVLLGVQGQQWQSTVGGTSRQTVRSVLAVVQWYPWSALRLFVRGGTGIVQGTVAPRAAGAQPGTARGTGVLIALDAGYDLLLSHHFGISLQVGEQIAGLGDLTVGGVLANDVIAYVSRVGVALVWR
jgi:hypothetical protein